MKCDIDGVIIKEAVRHADERGWLAELFRIDELPEKNRPAMAYLSLTKPGVARGPHEHKHQDDLFCFLGPSTFRLYLWDNRPSSKTFRQKVTLDFEIDDPIIIIVPAGIVHAYKNIGATHGFVLNAPNRLYKGEGRRDAVDEIRYEEISDASFKLDD